MSCACNFNMQFTHVHVQREGSVKFLMTQRVILNMDFLGLNFLNPSLSSYIK